MEEEAFGLDGEHFSLPVRRQEVCELPAMRQEGYALPARKRKKGIAELEDDVVPRIGQSRVQLSQQQAVAVPQVELPVGGQKDNTEPFSGQKGDQDDRSGPRMRRRRVETDQVGGVASKHAAMEQPTNSSQASTRLEQEPQPPSSGQGAAALPANIRSNGSYHCTVRDSRKHTNVTFAITWLKPTVCSAATSRGDMQWQDIMCT